MRVKVDAIADHAPVNVAAKKNKHNANSKIYAAHHLLR